MNRDIPEDNTLIYGHRYVLKPRIVFNMYSEGYLQNKPEYDDNYPEYIYIEPVEYADDCYMGDCWIVNEDGDICPGYNVSPVPFHIDNLVKVQGVRAATATNDY